MAGRSGEPKPIIRRGSNFIVIIRFLGKSSPPIPAPKETGYNRKQNTHNLPKHTT